MNKTQYNSIIYGTVNQEPHLQGLELIRKICDNMGVALPHGDCEAILTTLRTNNYMGWRRCSITEAKQAINNGTATIAISENNIAIIAAENNDLSTVENNGIIIIVNEVTPALEVVGMEFYAYNYAKMDEEIYLADEPASVMSLRSRAYVPVTSVEICSSNLITEEGKKYQLEAMVYPLNATNQSVTWCSDNTNVAEIDPDTGCLTAKSPGTVTITATASNGKYDTYEVWIKGKTPVFLIHGRTSNSKDVWGINNNILDKKNDHLNSDINASSLNGKKYIDVNSQKLGDFEPNKGDSDADYPCNLGNKLLDAGYKKNINLFAFNYPNEDAVKYSAQKFLAYIANLISYVRSSGGNEMKACFYATRNDYDNNNFKINIVGHSMGGLVARYFIENLYQDNHVDKLITICTPHWGSGLANVSGGIGEIIEDLHVLADHDLDLDSAMFGGNNPINLNCHAGLNLNPCYIGNYVLTDALQYNRPRSTKYYAIAGIDYPSGVSNFNDSTFEMPTNFTTMQQIVDYFTEKGICSFSSTNMSIIEINPKSVGDNMVGFFSQIGWIGDKLNTTPTPRIQIEKIFVDVDTDGGNSILSRLHSKIPHRTCILRKVCSYLNE